MHLFLATLLLMRVTHEVMARVIFLKAFETGMFPDSNIENLLNNNFGFLLGFWNVVWWILFIATLIWWIATWTVFFKGVRGISELRS